MQVIVGVDPHKASHTAVAIGAGEDELASERVPHRGGPVRGRPGQPASSPSSPSSDDSASSVRMTAAANQSATVSAPASVNVAPSWR